MGIAGGIVVDLIRERNAPGHGRRLGRNWCGRRHLRVHVPDTAVSNVGRVGEPVRLYTSLQVREDSLTLFGFPTDDERQTFETLLNISGIGPRLALAMLGRFSPQSLAQTVDSGDTKALSSVPGIGRRTASRIVLELKGKLDLDFAAGGAAAPDSDLVDALTALGYGDNEAREALARTAADGSDEDRIRAALEHLAVE